MAIPEPHGILSTPEQRANNIIKSLNADLRAAAADLAAAQGRIWALEAENERLRNENAQLGMTVQLIAFSSNPDLEKFIALAKKHMMLWKHCKRKRRNDAPGC